MEEYGPSPDQVEETPIERRRFLWGRFHESWKLLKEKDSDPEKKAKDKKKSRKKPAEEQSKKDEISEADWKPERLRDRFSSFFRSLVRLEPLPAAVTEIVEKQPDELAQQYEELDSEPQFETTTYEPDEVPAEEGVLAVSADAQIRYYGHELDEDTSPESDWPDQAEVEIDEIETDHPVEHEFNPNMYVEPTPVASEQRASSKAEPVSEVLRRRQAERLERRVKKLRRRTRNIKHEQADMRERQNKFAKHLEANQKAQEQFEKVTVPKMEADRKKLRQRLEDDLKSVKMEIPAASAIIAERSNQKVEIKTETVPQIDNYFEVVERPVKTEKAAVKVESPRPVPEAEFEDDGYRETYYERRHEVKDNPAMLAATLNSNYSDASQNYSSIPPTNFIPPLDQPVSSDSSKLGYYYDRFSLQPGESMYRQAAVNGAAGGIIILALLGLLMLIR